MTKARTRIWSILLVTVLLLSLLTATALAAPQENCADGDSCTQHEAAIGTTHYDTIGEAIDAANKVSGSGTTTVKLLKDATLQGGEQSGSFKIKRILKNITLDPVSYTHLGQGYANNKLPKNVPQNIPTDGKGSNLSLIHI